MNAIKIEKKLNNFDYIVTNPPLDENGASYIEIDSFWYVDSVEASLNVQSSSSTGTPTIPPGGSAIPGPPIAYNNE